MGNLDTRTSEQIVKQETTYRKFTPIIFVWYAVIIIGLVIHLLHLLSWAIMVAGFACLFAHVIGQIVLRKNKHWLMISSCVLSLLFVVVLFAGELFNNGYPINHVGIIVYFVVLIPAVIVSLLRQRQINNNP